MSQILDELNEIVYISDLETYDIKYLNKAGCKAVGLKTFTPGLKCYSIIFNQNKPCEFCPLKKLTKNKIYKWDFYNPILKRTYLLKDKLIEYEGKLSHMEIAEDITEARERHKALENTEKAENTIIRCIKLLHEKNNIEENIKTLLSEICSFLHSNNAYIFELNKNSMTLKNIYIANSDSNQNDIPKFDDYTTSSIPNWIKILEKGEYIYIKDRKNIPISKTEYAFMQYINVNSIFLAPIFANENELFGFIGVDNPQTDIEQENVDMIFKSISFFLTSIIQKEQIARQFKYLSYHDTLTDMQNRNKYTEDINKLKKVKSTQIGIAFVDMNGLKRLNDTKGHHAGDKAIIEISNKINASFPTENIYRIGGDEFVIVVPNITKLKFMQGISQLQAFSADKTKPYIAIGYNWFEQITDISKALKQVDTLMYEDKNRYYNHFRATQGL